MGFQHGEIQVPRLCHQVQWYHLLAMLICFVLFFCKPIGFIFSCYEETVCVMEKLAVGSPQQVSLLLMLLQTEKLSVPNLMGFLNGFCALGLVTVDRFWSPHLCTLIYGHIRITWDQGVVNQPSLPHSFQGSLTESQPQKHGSYPSMILCFFQGVGTIWHFIYLGPTKDYSAIYHKTYKSPVAY